MFEGSQPSDSLNGSYLDPSQSSCGTKREEDFEVSESEGELTPEEETEANDKEIGRILREISADVFKDV